MSSKSHDQKINVQRNWRRLLGYGMDLVAFSLSSLLAFELRFDGALPAQYIEPMFFALCVWASVKSVALLQHLLAGGTGGIHLPTTLYGLCWLTRLAHW